MQSSQSQRWSALVSLVLPGGGQLLLGERGRFLGIILAVAGLAALILWQNSFILLIPLAGFWLWNAWDAYRLAGRRPSSLTTPFILGAIILYGLGVSATQFRLTRLATGLSSIQPYVRALFDPELLEYPTEDVTGLAPIQIPCVEPLPEPDRAPTVSPSVTVAVPCAAVGDLVEVSGSGFLPDFEGEIWWINPIGDVQRAILNSEPVTFVTDGDGRFTTTLRVPQAVPLTMEPAPGETQTHTMRVEQHRPFGSPQPTETLSLVLDKIGETIALAFLATVMGVIFAVPVSFLAARNLMEGNRVTLAIYTVTRTVLNVIRSIETLMWAIIFAVWVGLGPFGGTLALWLHTVAALGKLYSEAIESIDPGPIEAIRATGARGPQVVVYAVLPQILPTFTSFTLYRLDINVRLSTVIGLVSDAGLGFLVIQWIRLNRFSSMATAIIAIVLVVAALDLISGWLRERIIEGPPPTQVHPARRAATRFLLLAGFVATFAWSWNVAEIDLEELIRGAPDGLRLAEAFAVPDVITRPTEERSVSEVLAVPCGLTGIPAGSESEPPEGSSIELSQACGAPGDPLTIVGRGLPPNSTVSIRWVLPDGAFLRVRSNCCQTDEAGTVRLEAAINPVMEIDTDAGEETPGSVAIVWNEVVGGPQLSQPFRRVVDLSLVTLLMALMATTFGSLFAIPLSFLAARNITGDGPVGRTVYYTFRTIFNLLRSIEPLILVLIAAAWVGAGPFAGVIALTFNNIPNLAKLFSESIEEIDPGPVEAVTATGANRLQTLVFAVVPQLVPKFLAFILYQWDINIRMSTVIGFVGGGGIGQQFRLWVGQNQYAAAGTATWAIVLMVWSMDYMSARAREELV